MVCLSAAVMTKGGKVLVARQFVEMTRMRIENHLATFPKVMGADKQHNTVETGEVRYVYQPVEALMLVLVTNKHSNIVEDLEMLRLFAKVLNEYCRARSTRRTRARTRSRSSSRSTRSSRSATART